VDSTTGTSTTVPQPPCLDHRRKVAEGKIMSHDDREIAPVRPSSPYGSFHGRTHVCGTGEPPSWRKPPKGPGATAADQEADARDGMAGA
jgi:hypothetical protein